MNSGHMNATTILISRVCRFNSMSSGFVIGLIGLNKPATGFNFVMNGLVIKSSGLNLRADGFSATTAGMTVVAGFFKGQYSFKCISKSINTIALIFMIMVFVLIAVNLVFDSIEMSMTNCQLIGSVLDLFRIS